MSEFTWEVVQTADPSSGKTVIVSHHCALWVEAHQKQSQALSKFSNSDIIIYVGCGERGNGMYCVYSCFQR